MKLKVSNGTIIFEDENNSFEIFKTLDSDIWFVSKNPNITQIISSQTRNNAEWRSYDIFERLIRQIIGKFILEDDKENASLPKDFVDLENKTITWHSDNGTDNVLKLLYEDKNITISITKDPQASLIVNNSVRVRTDGSHYGYYYQIFTEFYRELLQFANSIAIKETPNQIETETHSKEKVRRK